MGTNYYADIDGSHSRLHVAKTSGGWKPAIQRHDGCMCRCFYRDWYTDPDELFEFIMSPGVRIYDEYGQTWSKRLFVEKLRRWNDEQRRSHVGQSHCTVIDGWDFLSGHWS